MIELAEKIEISDKLIEKIKKIDAEKTDALAQKCMSKGFHVLKTENDLVRLAVILNLAVKIKERYIKEGINEKIYYDTMSDIRIWCERNGNRGLKNYGWLQNHVKFELFRLGRLQFQLYECKNRTLLYDKLPFKYGEKLMYIHIPEGEKLDSDLVHDSLIQAGDFFDSYFPKHTYKYYFCESWLLFEGNKDFMDENSNIVKFMSFFTHCYSVKIDVQAIERIFGKRQIIKKRYSENTSLQRKAKEYMKQGNRLGIGICVIDRNKYNRKCL